MRTLQKKRQTGNMSDIKDSVSSFGSMRGKNLPQITSATNSHGLVNATGGPNYNSLNVKNNSHTGQNRDTRPRIVRTDYGLGAIDEEEGDDAFGVQQRPRAFSN